MSTSGTPTPPKFKPATYTALDPGTLKTTTVGDANQLATQYDQQYYAASDADYAARNPDLVAANKAAEQNVLDMQQGNVPAGLTAELTRAGLADGSAALSGGIVPGSSGSFGLSRQLGVDYGAYTQQADQNLAALDALNPQRSFGINGAQALNLQQGNDQTYNSVLVGNQQSAQQVALANATGQNASNQGGFAGALQAYAAQRAGLQSGINTGAALGANAFGQYLNYSNGAAAAQAAQNAGTTFNTGVGALSTTG